jgi:hypothetical protein
MEEKKLKSAEVKPINGASQDNKETKQRLSYEQLNQVCSELYQQNQNLMKQLEYVNQTAMFKRLDYLFMVLKYESVIKDPDFVNSCIAEIKDAIIIQPETGKEGEA